jgi:alpha-1,6-mannosyltransferase
VFTAMLALGLLSAAIYWLTFKSDAAVPIVANVSGLERYVIIFLVLSAFYFIGVWLVCRIMPVDAKSWRLTGMILFFAVIFRIGLIAPDPVVLSKDMYRYMWDGRVQHNGINPYLHPPGAIELKDLRDKRVFPNINRKDYPTLYPAGAQVFFRVVYSLVGDSVSGFKATMVFFDLLTLVMLAALLRSWGLSLARLIIYAWNPLVIFEISYSGHLEGITVFLMTAALVLYVTRKKMAAIFMLALSAAVKLYPALLLAAFLNRGMRLKGIILFSSTIMLLYLPFIGAGTHLPGFLPVYLNNPYESFNLGVKYLLMGVVPGLEYRVVSWLFIFALAIAGLVVFVKHKENMQALRYGYMLTGLLMILMPASLHPWYVVLVIPFLVIYPSPAWLVFSCTVSLSYLKYISPQGIMPMWVLLVEYLPLFVMLSAEFILSRSKGLAKQADTDGLDNNRKMMEVRQ